ncbi:MAG: hypothetical protein ACOYD4_18250 [Solirubrobacterales bacterium]|jgi:hypothetical protein
MKKKIQYVAAIALLALLTFSTSVMAQPDPGGGGDPGGGAPPVGGGAPIGSGVYILIAMALAYGISRWYALKKVKAVQE